MSFEDKSLVCSDCGVTFTFGAGEQEFFATKGYTNEPKRCTTCRSARKESQGNTSGSSYGYGNGANRPVRQMFPAVCAQCGKSTEVPFEPSNGRPVYCRDCYNKINTNR